MDVVNMNFEQKAEEQMRAMSELANVAQRAENEELRAKTAEARAETLQTK